MPVKGPHPESHASLSPIHAGHWVGTLATSRRSLPEPPHITWRMLFAPQAAFYIPSGTGQERRIRHADQPLWVDARLWASSYPVLYLQIGHTRELFGIIGNQNSAERQSVCRNHHVQCPNGLPLPLKI